MEDLLENKPEFPFSIPRIHPDHPSLTERYFTPKFFIPKLAQTSFEHPAADQCVLFHSNRIAVITLAPNHPIVKEQKSIDKIEFIQEGINNAVSGRYKKGGQKLRHSTVLCRIYSKDEMIYTVTAAIKASLIEINKNLIQNPQLVVTHTYSKGYIAIVKETFEQDNEKLLLNYDEYIAKVN